MSSKYMSKNETKYFFMGFIMGVMFTITLAIILYVLSGGIYIGE